VSVLQLLGGGVKVITSFSAFSRKAIKDRLQ
jgi:hypothetical protein